MAATRKTTTAPTIPQDGKCIRYDRSTKDYACYLNGQFVGYAPTYHDAETNIANLYHEQLQHTAVAVADDAAEMDAQSAETARLLAAFDAPDHNLFCDLSASDKERYWARYEELAALAILNPVDQAPAADDVVEQVASLVKALVSRRLQAFKDGPAEHTSAPAVRVQPLICDDAIDRKNHGKEIGIGYVSGSGSAKVEAYFPHSSRQPCALLFGQSELSFDEMERLLPGIVAVLNDPRVKAARQERAQRKARRAGVA